MVYEIVLDDVAARPIAAVHASVPVGQVGAAWRPALDKVWAFLRRHDGLRTDGHNIFVYHHPVLPGAPMEVDFGVEVSRPFEPEDEIVFTQTPAGPVARTVHVGPPDQLAARQRRDRSVVPRTWPAAGGVSWEIYGDPGDDPATFEVAGVLPPRLSVDARRAGPRIGG